MENKFVKIGVGVIIIRDDKVLLGLRQGSHGAGEWAFPGGKVEFGETIFEAAIREAKEESGIDVTDLELISIADEMRYIDTDGKHFVVIGVKANAAQGEPLLMEPDKFTEWQWFPVDKLPSPMFEGSKLSMNNYLTKNIYTEVKYRK
ncbi:MAG: Nudix hydrolase 1 [Parcubacteria group bacterium GW2011_GWC2_39_14]|nr:MAG: Nudix hydrolase 1 [Parcubacteria group bacterium GW2011_GWC2_39_14]KKR54419.1 MAG: Nudix hydrolase 1 [Parcubacteria group bacterium GW2011_GWA2_40_23]